MNTTRNLFEALLAGKSITYLSEHEGTPKPIWFMKDDDIVDINETGLKLYEQPLTALIINEDFININGFKVPEPCRKTLKVGTVYYYFEPFIADNTNNVNSCIWTNEEIDLKMLDKGLLHLTREAAEIHAKALLSFTRSEDLK